MSDNYTEADFRRDMQLPEPPAENLAFRVVYDTGPSARMIACVALTVAIVATVIAALLR